MVCSFHSGLDRSGRRPSGSSARSQSGQWSGVLILAMRSGTSTSREEAERDRSRRRRWLIRDHCYGREMSSPVLLCTDGSDLALRALTAGLELVGRDHRFVLVTVSDAPDPESLAGSGHAGAELSPDEYDQKVAKATEDAASVIDAVQRELGIAGAEVRVVHGDPGPAVCQLASELSARAIVVGSRGRGGLKRALLGSVSDHIVRNAPCSVIVTPIQAST